MLLFILAFLGGVLTILSPCILPVIPFVFARADQSFRRATLPMLAGMAATFSVFAALATAGGNWIVRTNEYGRWIALAVMAVLGLTLLIPAFAELLTRPLVRLGARLQTGQNRQAGPGGSLLIGASIGLLWAPCAGPILGLVLAASALSGLTVHSLGLLLAFALGAACSLAVALLAGQRAFQAMKRGLGAEAWLRRALGGLVLAGVVAIALGADTQLLAAVQYFNTNGIEQHLVAALDSPPPVRAAAQPMVASIKVSDVTPVAPPLHNEGRLPSLNGAVAWINSPRLTRNGLRGKVVLVDFWTYSCINCLRELPYVEAWAKKYSSQGLVVIGVHSPEFAFERDVANVRKAVTQLGITFPVAVDSNHKIWDAFSNEYWPAEYFIDANGEIRHHSFGEGDYAQSERVIQELLAEAHHQPPAAAESPAQPLVALSVDASGAEAAADGRDLGSPETYIGYARGERFDSPQRLRTDTTATYTAPVLPTLNQWGLAGTWNVGPHMAVLKRAGGEIIYRFHARDLHLVLGSATGKPIRFRVLIDGAPPGPNHGVDDNAQGYGTLRFQRLYQLIRQRGPIEDRTFTIQFLDSGVQAYSFTFG
jgi:cytochrome c biogenesis protein CcdA/thiol-disulfide isomerase/thioredoxin